MKVASVERKSAVLTPSSLACLSDIATVNLTAGCAHRCVYCYAEGYSNSPSDGTICLYANTAEKLARELQHKRKLPRAVYFSPSSDLFQPVPEVLDMAFEVLSILFQWNIGVSFLTKGQIPQRHIELLKANASLVQAQIGLTTIDERIQGMFEPQAALPQVRLDQARELVEAGIATTGRLDPILPGLTDDEISLRNVCAGFAEAGVTTLAASTLFLRPAITGSLMKNLGDAPVRTRLFDAFHETKRLAMCAESSFITALSQEARQVTFDRLREVAAEFGITVRVCACKNFDIDSGVCHIAGRSSNRTNRPIQARLF